MLSTNLLPGQGLGNQLWVIFALQNFARRLGVSFSVEGRRNFKANGFRHLELQSPDLPLKRNKLEVEAIYREKQMFHNLTGADVTQFVDFDPDTISDNMEIIGYFQSEKYLPPRSEIVRQLSTESDYFDGCTISLRGGEYRGIDSVFLPLSYYQNAIDIMKETFGNQLRFQVVTDDLALAHDFFPDYPAYSSGGVKRIPFLPYFHPPKSKVYRDFSRVQRSKCHILANSSFSWWAAYSSPDSELVIAPKYWAAFNYSDGFWSQGDSLTSGWLWLDKNGLVFSSDQCEEELASYRRNSSNIS